MSAFLYGVLIKWKLDLRNKGILLTYYIVPLVFFLFMSGIFTSINEEAYKTLIPSMTVFGVTMGAVIGFPTSLVEFFNSDIKKSYKVYNIPFFSIIGNNFISGFIHLFIMSLILFFIAPIAFDATIPNNIFLYFIGLLIFLFASLSIGTLIGLFVKSISKLTMISQFIFLPSIMLSGIMFPVDLLPNIFRNIGKVFPATLGYEIMSTGKYDTTSLLPLIIIIIFSIIISIWKVKRLEII